MELGQREPTSQLLRSSAECVIQNALWREVKLYFAFQEFSWRLWISLVINDFI